MRRLRPHAHAERGVTLIESMVALTISAILMCSGLPAFTDYLRNAKLREAGNALLADALLARSESIRRNGTVQLLTVGSSVTISYAGAASGVDRQRALPDGVSATTSTISFGSDGRVPADATVKTQLSGVECSSSGVRCPVLQIDSGGGIRLCGDSTSCN